MFEIKIDEKFQHLNRAPIAEAAFEVRARASAELDENAVRKTLESELSGYAFLDSQREFQFGSKIKDGKPESQEVVDLGWKGVRFRSEDGKQIVQVNKNGLIFSRLPPYQNWEDFSSEGLRIWEIFKKVASPAELHRIGLRFINRIMLPVGEANLGKYLSAPLTPLGPDEDFELPFMGFMHHDVLGVPGHQYAVNLVRTVQPPAAGNGLGVIVDIDVFTLDGASLDESKVSHYLSEMRWLKNKVFFGSITEQAKELCK